MKPIAITPTLLTLLLTLSSTHAQSSFFTSCTSNTVGQECCYITSGTLGDSSGLGTCELNHVHSHSLSSPCISLRSPSNRLPNTSQGEDGSQRLQCVPPTTSTGFYTSCNSDDQVGKECCISTDGNTVQSGTCSSTPVSRPILLCVRLSVTDDSRDAKGGVGGGPTRYYCIPNSSN